MRDEMSKNPTIDTQTKLHLIEIEKLVNKYASAVISVSEPILNDFKIICPNISVFEEVRNGFDHLFLDQIPLKSESSILNFGYFGSFYGAQKPDVFFEALLLLNAYDDAIDFKINIFGAHNNFNIPLKLRDKINMVQGLPYDEAILKMKEMDANILIIPNNGRKGVYSGKLFDYISVQRPIIALLDKEDVAADLINEFKCGYVSDFKDVNEVFESLKELIKDKSEGVSKVATHDQVVSLHRKNQVIKLKDVINQLICK
jgi:glycosyltransferase involved in cell wall biosynthesis